MQRKRFLFPVWLLLQMYGMSAARETSFRQQPDTVRTIMEEQLDFIENKGQWETAVRYKADIPGGILFLTDQGFVYHFISEGGNGNACTAAGAGLPAADTAQVTVRHHAYRVRFLNAHMPAYETGMKRSYYHNYFIGKDQSRWAGHVGVYGQVTLRHIYEGIDMVIYSQGTSLKYDFIVAPGADPGIIRLGFEGVSPELTPDGSLKIVTSVNEVVEQAPYTYQQIRGKEVAVACSYILENGQLGFRLPEGYDRSCPLVIDPSLVFSTFSGSTGDAKLAYATTYDAAGNLYAGASAWDAGWPVTLGAFQTAHRGGGPGDGDAAFNKYNAAGNSLIYSTYYGGSKGEQPLSMIVNSREELIVVGRTTSSDLATTPGCYDDSLNGYNDLFVVHFNKSGSGLVGATYIGGDSVEASMDRLPVGYPSFRELYLASNTQCDVSLGNDETIWVATLTGSGDFPVTADALQPVFGGWPFDAVVFRLTPDCSSLPYSTYLGGAAADGAIRLTRDREGNMLVCGFTQSHDFPVTAGSLHASSQGFIDGFVTRIHAGSGALMHSTYLGTDTMDSAHAVQVDDSGYVYVMGRTTGNYPATPGVYILPGRDVFLDKLAPDLSASLVSTRIGNRLSTSSRYTPGGFLVDRCGNIYVAGLDADSSLPVTADAYDTQPKSFWLCVLERNFSSLQYASYFGSPSGDHSHGGVQRLDPRGVLYYTICSHNSGFPTTTGAVFPVKRNTSVDNLSFKFDFEFFGPDAGFGLAPGVRDTGCAPHKIRLQNQSAGAVSYTWDFGDGTMPVSGITDPEHLYTRPGVYTVTLYAHGSGTCITEDTAYLTITVLQVGPDISLQDTLVCNYASAIDIKMNVSNTTSRREIRWRPSQGILGSDTTPIITVNPAVNTVYYVTVADTVPGICRVAVTDTVHIEYAPRMVQLNTGDTALCIGNEVHIRAQENPAYSYLWSPTDGVSDSTVPGPVIIPSRSGVYTLTGTYPGCPDTTVQIAFDVQEYPVVAASPDTGVCQWAQIELYATVHPARDDYRYQWTPITPVLQSPASLRTQLIADTSTIYTLTAQTPAGCSGADSVKVYVMPVPPVNIGPDTSLCPGDAPVRLANLEEDKEGARYRWSTGNATTTISIREPGIYWLQVISENACTATDSITIHRSCYLDIPNVFTPNGDGVNDYFFPHSLLSRGVRGFHMQVFNRWGQLVYETKRTSGSGWDGTINGQPLSQGVFIYLIEAGFENGKTEIYQGNVTLMR